MTPMNDNSGITIKFDTLMSQKKVFPSNGMGLETLFYLKQC